MVGPSKPGKHKQREKLGFDDKRLFKPGREVPWECYYRRRVRQERRRGEREEGESRAKEAGTSFNSATLCLVTEATGISH